MRAIKMVVVVVTTVIVTGCATAVTVPPPTRQPSPIPGFCTPSVSTGGATFSPTANTTARLSGNWKIATGQATQLDHSIVFFATVQESAGPTSVTTLTVSTLPSQSLASALKHVLPSTLPKNPKVVPCAIGGAQASAELFEQDAQGAGTYVAAVAHGGQVWVFSAVLAPGTPAARLDEVGEFLTTWRFSS